MIGLLDSGARFGSVNELGDPLFLAVMQGDPELVGKLLAWGANPNFQSGSGYTPLYRAAQGPFAFEEDSFSRENDYIIIASLLIAAVANDDTSTYADTSRSWGYESLARYFELQAVTE